MATKYEYYDAGDDWRAIIAASTTAIAQTFTPSSEHTIGKVVLKLYRIGNPDILTINIQGVNGNGDPDGTTVSTGTTDGDTLTTGTGGEWRDINLTGSLLLNGTQYAIVLTAPSSDGSNKVAWIHDSTGTYAGGKYTLSLDSESTWDDGGGDIDCMFEEWSGDAPAKPTSPSPGHEDTGVEFSTTPLSYTASDDPAADTYDIYFGIKDSVLTKIAETEDITSWITPYVILNIKDYNPSATSGLRSPIAGDILTHGDDSYTIAYVVRGVLINLQYQAKLYAFRTAGPGGKNPGDILVNGAGDVEVTLNDQQFFYDDVEQIYLPPNTTFEWRVDATNEVGTTTGDTWEFTTPPFKQPKVSYVLIAGGSGNGPHDYPPGEEGVDWNWTGENNMISIRRLVAAADNKIWVEDI